MNDNGKWEDKGIRQALKSEKPVRLTSNFTYRMLQRLEQERLRKGKTAGTTVVCTHGLHYPAHGNRMPGRTVLVVQRTATGLHSQTGRTTDIFQRVGILPSMLGTLPILAGFNWWLRKRFRHLLE